MRNRQRRQHDEPTRLFGVSDFRKQSFSHPWILYWLACLLQGLIVYFFELTRCQNLGRHWNFKHVVLCYNLYSVFDVTWNVLFILWHSNTHWYLLNHTRRYNSILKLFDDNSLVTNRLYHNSVCDWILILQRHQNFVYCSRSYRAKNHWAWHHINWSL